MAGAFTSNKTTQQGAAVNNATRDPMQGFDCDVWVLDQATGAQVLLGRFTSIQITVRNSTEPYLEFNNRVARMLDGEFQFGWVMERGQLDVSVIAETFGFSEISRELRVGRSPRFNITFDMNAPELDEYNGLSTANPTSYDRSKTLNQRESVIKKADSGYRRRASGQFILPFCKIDTWTMGAMAGQKVVANRWEGLAEGIYINDKSEQVASDNLVLNSVDDNVRLRNPNKFIVNNGTVPSTTLNLQGNSVNGNVA